MNFSSFFMLLISLSIISTITLLLVFFLDIINIRPNQKIAIIKVGIIMIVIAPLIFLLLKHISWHMIDIKIIDSFIVNKYSSVNDFVSKESNTHWSSYLLGIYVLGLFLMLFRIIYWYQHVKNNLASSLPAVIHGQRVFLSEHIHSPLSFGIPIAKIYFPRTAEKSWSTREIQMSLIHEKIHVQHKDSAWKLLSLVSQAILFFLPWSYFLHRKFALEMEMLCDEITCAEAHSDFKEYGQLLLTMVCAQPHNLMSTNLIDSTIKRRLKAMNATKVTCPILVPILGALLFFTGSASLAIGSGVIGKNNILIKSKIFIDGTLVSSPQILATLGEKASINLSNNNTSSLTINVIANNQSGPKDIIDLNFDIHQHNGQEKLHVKPQIIIEPNQEGKIVLKSESGTQFELQLTVERQ